MRYYNKLFKLNSSNNTFEKASVKDLMREFQGIYIDSQYISNLCADTSVDNVLFALLFSTIDILKSINKKMNGLEKRIRTSQDAKQKLAEQANENSCGDDDIACHFVNSTAKCESEYDRKVDDTIKYPILPDFCVSTNICTRLSVPQVQPSSNGVMALKELSFDSSVILKIIKTQTRNGIVFIEAEDFENNSIRIWSKSEEFVNLFSNASQGD